MPELPEVETVVRSLRPVLVGRRILEVELPALAANGSRAPQLQRLLAASPREFQRRLCGAKVEQVRRYGKNILIEFRRAGRQPGSGCLLVHLGMTGHLLFERAGEPLRPHTHAILGLDVPGLWLHYSDPRRFGRLRLLPPRASPLPALGPDPLEIPFEEFFARLRARRAMLKALLLDQRFLRGLGNIYADESLHRAGLHPQAIGARLRRPSALRLYRAIRETLSEAIAVGGSSISSYVDARGQAGWFQQEHQVYGRAGEPCLRCGARIRRILIASRSTHFCPHCQRTGRPRRQPAASANRGV